MVLGVWSGWVKLKLTSGRLEMVFLGQTGGRCRLNVWCAGLIYNRLAKRLVVFSGSVGMKSNGKGQCILRGWGGGMES
jgi:hypothetical protein